MAANLAEFDQAYRLEHEARFTPERTGREVAVLMRALELKPHERVLDLGCGWGRHLAELKRRGFENLVGVDAQGAFLEPIAGVTLLARDATDPDFNTGFDTEFDAVYCAFNALFSVPDAASQVFGSVARALRPGGRFLLDTSNRERLARGESPTRSWRGGDGLPWTLEETRFDLRTGAQTLLKKRLFADGHEEEVAMTRFHYTLTELVRLAETAGLSVGDVYGGWGLEPYTTESPRTLLVARKE